ncbi:MAG: DUF362 domain-containing protein [Candidatus Rifleibacteriota bacterium]
MNMSKEPVFAGKCENYDFNKILSCIESAIDSLGGLNTFVKPGQKVLIKPNMLSCKTPEHAATTHPEVVKAVATIMVKAGAKVFIGDSPPMVFGKTEEFWQKTGYKKAAEDSGANLLCFETAAKSDVSLFTNGETKVVHVIKDFFTADLVVNLPKLKTHNLTRITGAIKNLFGLVPGLQKAQWHKVYTRSKEFSHFITDLAAKLPARLNILDAIEGMEGQGPAGGNVIRPGFLLASRSAVAIDRVICAATGIDENSVEMLKRAAQLNFGPKNLDEIEIMGASLDEIRISNFVVPGKPVYDRLPAFLISGLKALVWAGPKTLKKKCIGCGRCVEICPVNAIKLVEQQAEFQRQICISCFCCMEVCPVNAIEAQKSPLLAIAFKLRSLKKRLRK